MPLKLTALSADHYKRLTLAEMTFDPDKGGVVALMGPNEAGKSSMLDGFEALIAGRKAPKQAMPIHKGADSARIIATFREDDGDELVVTRLYTAKGTTIEVRKNGLRVATPDEILRRLYSHVALDPLAFANLDAKAQTETLVKLIGFDPSKIDEEAANVYATRTEVGQRVKQLAGQLEGFPPEDPTLMNTPLVDVAEVQQTLEDAREHNEGRAGLLAGVEDVTRSVVGIEQAISDAEARLKGMHAKLDERQRLLTRLVDEANGIAELPTQGYLDQIASADSTNEAIREQRRRAQVADQLASAQAEQKAHTDRLAELAAEKTAGFASAKMPIPGLTVEGGEVFLDGTPFSQTSAGGKLRTSTAVAMALNPELRAIVIRDGSLLDSKNRAVIDDLAKANDFTVLMEIVDESAPTGVIFEDGAIVREVGA